MFFGTQCILITDYRKSRNGYGQRSLRTLLLKLCVFCKFSSPGPNFEKEIDQQAYY